MRKKAAVIILTVMIAFSLCACSTESNVLKNSSQKQTEETTATPEQSTEPKEINWTPMPMVRVNDVIYQSYDYGSHLEQKLDDSWNLVGEIESVSEITPLTANFQANFNVAGASVYHSSNASFIVNP